MSRAPWGTSQRFLEAAMAVETDDCVLWPYGKTDVGYGSIVIDGRRAAPHRVACESAHGPAPEGTQAAHSCGVRHCFNPRHLRWALPKENAADKVLHGTAPTAPECHWSKLTEDEVAAIRSLFTGRHGEQTVLALQFGVSISAVNRVVRNKTWRVAA